MKIKVSFCEFWFKDKKGNSWFKVHFYLDSEKTAYVPSSRKYSVGEEIVLSVGRDNDGRAKVVIAR